MERAIPILPAEDLVKQRKSGGSVQVDRKSSDRRGTVLFVAHEVAMLVILRLRYMPSHPNWHD